MRLDKYLANMHIGSRSEVKLLIRKGLVLVDGSPVKDPGYMLRGSETVVAKGTAVEYREHFYYMLNKPAGVITATEDKHDKTVLDLFPEELRRGLIPAGRLDKDTVGLLLITDDGELVHRLLSPAHHVDKRYLLHTDIAMDKTDIEAFRAGLTLQDGTELKEALLEISEADPCKAVITIREGKYHQIKRMLASRGKQVIYLKRLSMGPLTLDPALNEGEYRELTETEISSLLN